jgi:hypothetical protein
VPVSTGNDPLFHTVAQHTAPTLGRTSPAVRGLGRVSFALLTRRLGRAATLVWRILIRERHPNTGEAVMTRKDIAHARGFERLNDEVIKDALKQLAEAGLVVPVGWRTRDGALVYVRRVFGDVKWHRDVEVVPVPVQVSLWAKKPVNLGGKRVGAGRPKNNQLPPNGFPVAKAPIANEDGQLGTPPEGGSKTINYPPTTDLLKDHNGVSSLREESGDERRTRFGDCESESQHRLEMQRRVRGEAGQYVRVVDPLLVETHAVVDEMQAAETSCVLIGSGGAHRKDEHPVAIGAPHPAVPPFVVLAKVAPVTTPAPPRLDPVDPEARHVALMISVFEGAAWSIFGKRCWTFLREKLPPGQTKHHARMVAFAKKLIEYDIPPAQWIAWSIAHWKRHAVTKAHAKPPSPAYVFSIKRIDDKATRSWFASEAEEYTGTRLHYTPAARELLVAQNALRHALRKVPATATDEAIVGIVMEHLPEARRIALIDQAKRQADEMNEDLRARAYLGEWVWG